MIGDQNRTAETEKVVQLVDKLEIVVIEQRDKEPPLEPWLYFTHFSDGLVENTMTNKMWTAPVESHIFSLCHCCVPFATTSKLKNERK